MKLSAKLRWLAVIAAGLTVSCRGLLPAESPALVVRGPLRSRIHQPQALTYLAQTPRRATLQSSDSIGVGWTSIYANIHEVGNGPSIDVNIDGELWTNTLTVRKRVHSRVDLEVQIPTLYTTSGFLDPIVQGFHSELLFPNGGREDISDNQFGMDIVFEGTPISSMEEDRFGLLDIPVFATVSLADEGEGQPAVALRAGVGIPTGSEQAGFSNGAVDFGLGVLAEKSCGRWTFLGGVSYTVNEDPDGFAGSGVRASNPWESFATAELRWTDRLSLLTQLSWSTHLLEGPLIKEVNRNILDLGIGFAFGSGGSSHWTMSFHEDVIAESGHDFFVLLGWSRGF